MKKIILFTITFLCFKTSKGQYPPAPTMPACNNIATCNLICDGTFEGVTDPLFYSYFYLHPFAGNQGPNSTDIFYPNSSNNICIVYNNCSPGSANGTFNICGSDYTCAYNPYTTSNLFTAMEGSRFGGMVVDNTNGTPTREAMSFRLRRPMSSSKNYVLKFWARKKLSTCNNLDLKIYGSTMSPCHPSIITKLDGTISGSPCNYQTTQNWSVNVNTNSWVEYTVNINNPNANFNYLIISINNTPASGGYNYVYLDDIRLTEKITPSITQDITSACGMTNLNVSVSGGSPNYSYLWNDGAASQNRTWLNSGNYSVTVTDANFCTGTASFNLSIPSPYVSIGTNSSPSRPTATSVIPTLTSTPSNKTIYVWGNFTINSNMTFSNCTFLLDVGSKITVANGASLILYQCNLYTCHDKLWKGIEVDNGGNLSLNQTTIQDAHIAAEFKGSSIAEITNNTFLNNVIGLYFKTGSNPNFPFPVEQNTFNFNRASSLKNNYPGMVTDPVYGIQPPTPAVFNRPFAGIIALDQTQFNIGFSTNARNQFMNLTNGIIAYKVKNATFKYNRFENILEVAGNNNIANGNGIYYYSGLTDYDLMWTPNGRLKVEGLGLGSSVYDYTNCTRGIYSRQAVEEIFNHKMLNMVTGVEGLNSGGFTVKGNNLVATKSGIRCNFLTMCPNYNIYNNTIQFNSSSEANNAILIDNQMTEWCRHNFNYVSNNCITTSGVAGFGIATNNIKNTAANTNSCNTITINTPTSSLGGILANNCYSVSTDNYVLSTNRTAQSSKGGFAGAYPVAIHTNASYGDGYYNQYHKILVGMRYTGGCMPANGTRNLIYKNRFQDLNVGFRFDATLNLNDFETNIPWNSPTIFYNFGNEFNGTITTRAFGPGTNPPKISYNSSSAIYNPNPASTGIPFPKLTQTNYPPSFLGAAANNWTCGTVNSACGLPSSVVRVDSWRESLVWSKLRVSILTKTLDYASYSPEMVWQQELNLYRELKPIESTFASTSLEKQFIDEKEAQNFPELIALTDAEASLLPTEDNTLDALSATIQNIQAEIDSLTSLRDTIVDSLRPGIQTQIDASHQSLVSAEASLQSIIYQREAQRDALADSLRSINDSIQASLPSDSLLLVYNAIFYDKYAQGDYDLTPSQKASMYYLAHQCPFINENVVFKARSAYRVYDDTTYYDDSVLCTQAGLQYKQATNPSIRKGVEFSLSPNPSTDRVVLRMSEIPKESLTIYVSDMLGRVFLNETKSFTTNFYDFSAAAWGSGTYIVHVYQGKDMIFSTPLQISK